MRLPYAEGSVFLVPLKEGGYARGVVARASAQGKGIFGYFFGPRLASKDAVPLNDLKPPNAIMRIRFGDLGLINGEWPILGKIPSWNRSEWPMPDFVRRDPLGRIRPILVRHCDTDPMRIETEYPIDDDSGLETDSSYGYGAVEIVLSKLLGSRQQDQQMRADDRAGLEQLKSVSNVDVLHSISHYLYFPDEGTAKKVARSLREQGFAVEDRLGADDVNWLVLAKIQAVPTETVIAAMCEMLERIAEENQGEYDGWEAGVQNAQ